MAPLPEWYRIDESRLGGELLSRFVASRCDEATLSYLSRAARDRLGLVGSLVHRGLTAVLSEFDVNGWLGSHEMHLLSTEGAEALLGRPRGGRLLDVGAGSGGVTAHLRPLFERVEVTEVSRPMLSRLKAAGYVVHDVDVATVGVPEGRFDVIALLNILDRTSRPVALLNHCLQGLSPGGRLLISLPLPYTPCVYRGARATSPEQLLPIRAVTWEFGVERLVSQVLSPSGLQVERWTRLPYLSVGDAFRPLYVLGAVVMVCGRG
jgi:SAM-dependent methyltransferase